MIARRGLPLELRRIGIGIAGFAVLSLGLALLVVPVPGTTILVIPFGLGILAKEFAWARRLFVWIMDGARRCWARLRSLRRLPVTRPAALPLVPTPA
jgi:hypothetical protein